MLQISRKKFACLPYATSSLQLHIGARKYSTECASTARTRAAQALQEYACCRAVSLRNERACRRSRTPGRRSGHHGLHLKPLLSHVDQPSRGERNHGQAEFALEEAHHVMLVLAKVSNVGRENVIVAHHTDGRSTEQQLQRGVVRLRVSSTASTIC